MTELELELDAALVQTRLRKVIVRRYLFNSVSMAVTVLYVLNHLSCTYCVYTFTYSIHSLNYFLIYVSVLDHPHRTTYGYTFCVRIYCSSICLSFFIS